MEDPGLLSLIDLALDFLPVTIISSLVVIVAVVALSGFTLFRLFEEPPAAIYFAVSLAINLIVLIPLWIVSGLACIYRPYLWELADYYVFWFSVAMGCPTVIFLLMWELAMAAEREKQ